MIAGHIHHSCATFGVTHDSAYHISVCLFPTPFVLLYFPGVDYVAHKIQCFAGVVFEKVVELLGLAVSSAQVHVGNKNTAVSFGHTNIY